MQKKNLFCQPMLIFFKIFILVLTSPLLSAELKVLPQPGVNEAMEELITNLTMESNRDFFMNFRRRASLSRYFHEERFYCETPTMELMIENLPLTSKILRSLGIAPIEITGPDEGIYKGEDHHGTEGWFELINKEELQRLFYGWGGYEGNLFQVSGKVLLFMEYKEVPGVHNRPNLLFDIGIHVRLDSGFLNFMARIISPFIRKTIDNSLLWVMQVARRTALLIHTSYYTIYEKMIEDPLFTEEDIAVFKEYCLRMDKERGRNREYPVRSKELSQ